jgi:hypothetical protein
MPRQPSRRTCLACSWLISFGSKEGLYRGDAKAIGRIVLWPLNAQDEQIGIGRASHV